MNEKDRHRLLDMLDAAKKAEAFVEGKTREHLDEDEMLALALTRLLEIIGEAARTIPPETRETLSDIPWQAIIGMRHRIVHDYLHADYDVVWNTIHEDLPPLIELPQKIVGSE